jgi:hypothetical protein
MDNSTQKRFEPIFQKIEKNMADCDFYAAQQLYKTLFFRLSKKRDVNGSTQLLVEGACDMLNHSQFNNGVELALILIEHFTNNKVEINEESIDKILEIYSCFPKLTPYKKEDTPDPMYRRFVKTVINWSSLPSNNNQGDPLLHDAFAAAYRASGNYAIAEQHYLRGNIPKEFAAMLIEQGLGNSEEKLDFLVAKAVFQYLCLSNLKDANILFTTVKELDIENILSNSQLIAYLNYLLQTLEYQDAYPLAKILLDTYKYKKSFNVDEENNALFDKYIMMIQNLFQC